MNVTLPNGKVISGVPDGTTKEQVKAKAIAAGLATAEDFGDTVAEPTSAPARQYQDENSDIPQVDASGVPLPSRPRPEIVQPAPSFTERAKAAGETALTIGTGATAGLLGGMAGGLQGIGQSVLSGKFGTQEGANAAANRSAEVAGSLTYQPKSQLGQEYVGNIGEAAEPLAALSPATAELSMIGRSARASIPQAENAVNNLTGANRRSDIAGRIVAGSNDRELAPYMLEGRVNRAPVTLDEAGQVVNEAPPVQQPKLKLAADDIAKEAVKQGFDDGFVQAVKQTSPANRRKILQMVNTAERGKSDAVYSATNRPLDIAGQSLTDRVKFIRDTNSQAAKEVDAAAEGIKGQPVDYNPAINKFAQDMNDAGVSMNENGSLNFKGSDLEFSAGDKKLIQDVYNRARTIDGSDAYRVHKLKKLIDTTVDYGKSSQKGVTPQGERIVKNFRRAVDQSLDEAFPEYNTANTKYADTIQALDAFQDAAGTKIDLRGENADKALGSVARRLLSNAQSRVNLMDSIKNIEGVSQKYGSKFDDDIITQVMAADELDKVFGSAAKTSLAGDVEKSTRTAIKTAAGQQTLTGLAVEGASALAEKARGINQKNAFKSLKDLLSRGSDE